MMAYAMAHSNTDVIQLGEAYKACASTATSLGYSVEETTAVLATMANAGVKGGEAGTALNAIFTRLATNTKECGDTLAEYGVQIYDAHGILYRMDIQLADLTNLAVFLELMQVPAYSQGQVSAQNESMPMCTDVSDDRKYPRSFRALQSHRST